MTEMSMAPSNIATGTEVYTMDGERLGTVKTVRDDYFKVNASMQPDYWLRCDCLSSSEGYGSGRLTVAFTKDELDNFKEKMRDEDM